MKNLFKKDAGNCHSGPSSHTTRRLIIITIFCVLISGFGRTPAQVPQGVNYQALALNSSGEPIREEVLSVRLTILSSLTPETVVWQEVHSPVSTNQTGLFTVVLGSGTRQPVSAVPLFSDINWNIPEMYLRTHITYQSTEHLMGTTRLLSVPYAFSAGDVSGTLPKLSVAGEETGADDPLFEVKNKQGKTVFAVYNQGVRVYVGSGETKAVKGGFAIGSFDESKVLQEYFVVNPDCVRVYIDDNPDKAVKGGFAIGSFDESKAIIQEYLRVTRDSTRVYLNTDGTKAVKGGFAIGSFDESKGTTDYLHVSADSVRIYIEEEPGKAVKGGFGIGGFDESKGVLRSLMRVTLDSTRIYVNDTTKGFSVANIESGATSDFMKMNKVNYFIGHESGKATAPSTTGEQGRFNVFVGYQSGQLNSLGYKNVFMGYRAGMKNQSAEHNIFIGTESGVENLTGRYNTFIGSQTGAFTTTSENTFIGYSAGVLNETGQFNTFIGTNSGALHTSGDYSTFLGWGAGNMNTGSRNVFIGASSGSMNTGNGNVFIGYNSGSSVSGSNKLIITNSTGTPTPYPPLIYGDFSTRQVSINKASITTGYTLWVEGAAGGTLAWNSTSDQKLKKNIEPVSGALEKVSSLRGVTFEWLDENTYGKGRNLGFIAQELARVVPEVVNTGGEFMTVQYGPLTALLAEAIKEQQKIIDEQKAMLRQLEDRTSTLESIIQSLVIEIEKLKNASNNQK